jgi:hypothetical protein
MNEHFYSAPPLFDTEQAGKYLGIEPHTLDVWRSNKRYELPYVKIGRLVKYRKEDLDNFIAKNLQNNTSKEPV